ncbi:MAG: NUDIX hydrolase [Microlunatus sp.]|nr:NUDIX hydrolase [Microlunatus sp.]MDN5770030.1 NUDIX hydrolase [Microlunatus sp.]
MQHDGNGWVHCGLGHRHWGRFGAAGLLVVDRQGGTEPLVLLQHRAAWTASGDTWGVPGGAKDSHETAAQGALREAHEETGIPASAVRVGGEVVDDHGGGWSYTTVLARLVATVVLQAQEESYELRWVPISAVTELDLHPGFALTWPELRTQLTRSQP